jgi:hypothetical protein
MLLCPVTNTVAMIFQVLGILENVRSRVRNSAKASEGNSYQIR